MSSRMFTREQIEELVNEAKDTWEEYLQHDITIMTYVVKVDGKHWQFSFERSDGEGWLIYGDIGAEEVIPREKMVIEWMKV